MTRKRKEAKHGKEDEGRGGPEFGQHLVIEELPVPEPKEGKAVVKNRSKGLSHRPARGGWRLARETHSAVRPWSRAPSALSTFRRGIQT